MGEFLGASRVGHAVAATMSCMSLLRRPMSEDAFWSLIVQMGGRADEDAVQRLTESLRAQGPRSARAFAERLAKLLYELDREVLFHQPVRFEDDDPAALGAAEVEPLPMSDDTFLYLRAGIVARGRAVYGQVLAEPETLARGTWPECEDLLYVADEVAGDDVETKTSYETGSNRKHWGEPPAHSQVEASDLALPAVWVIVRDLSDGIEIETQHSDGRVEASVIYNSPSWHSIKEMMETTSEIVERGGGLPDDCGTQIQVQLDLGEGWRLPPHDDGLITVDDLLDRRARQVTVTVDAATVRGWTVPVRREALLGLAAIAVMSVLPMDHDGRDALQKLADSGADHLPV